MKVELSYEEIKSAYTTEVATVMSKLRSGKSIHKNAKPEELEWSFDWGYSVRSFSFAEIISGTGETYVAPTDPQAIADEKMATAKVCLRGKIGRWQGYALLGSIPQQVKDDAYNAAVRQVNKAANAKPLTQGQLNSLFAGGLMVVKV